MRAEGRSTQQPAFQRVEQSPGSRPRRGQRGASRPWRGQRGAWCRRGAGGAPMSRHRSRPGGRLSKSVAKARIAPERWKRIVDIPRFLSPQIPARDAFATDLDVGREDRWWRSARAGPPRPEGCCEGVRVRLPGVVRGIVEGGGARGPAVTVCSSRLRVRRGCRVELLGGDLAVASGWVERWVRRNRPVQSSGAVRTAAGAVPAPRPRFTSITHLAWWDGVSHVVTHPGSRARHLTREIVT